VVPDEPAHRASHPASIPLGPAAGTWAIGWVIGSLIVAPLVVAALGAELGGDLTIPQLLAVAVGAWSVFLVALVIAGKKFGTGDFFADFAARFRPIDLVGVPIGVVTQLGLVPLLYLPLKALWPDTFSSERLEERAQDLADRANGSSAVLLVLIVVIGAPIVEELVYRGLLQRSMASVVQAWPAAVFTAIWFSLIHLSPVEYPGLFVAGLVFGAGVAVTNRIGLSIVTHAAFNATGILIVLTNR
jgi:membrane protease YdiL (CAAX protease family)